MGRRGYGGGGRGRLYTYRHTVTTRTTCIKMGSDESHSNISFSNCEGQSHKTVSTDHNFWKERRAEAYSNRDPSAYQPNALPLGQTGSQKYQLVECCFTSAETVGLLGTGKYQCLWRGFLSCGPTALWNVWKARAKGGYQPIMTSELRSCVKVKVAVLGFRP